MRLGSLFAGIGGFDLAARWMDGWSTAWFSEIEPYASKVLAKHWPNVPNHGDITRINGREVEPVDILCGGFPCQDISLAGKGGGIEGARSGLWKHYARLIEEIRPRYVVAENVSALRSRGLGRVLQDLVALGYDAEWHCIPASYVGAPQRRDRIWIVAYAHGLGDEPVGVSRFFPGTPGAPEGQGHQRQRSGDPADGGREDGALANPSSDGRSEECSLPGRSAEGDRAEGNLRRGPLLSREGLAHSEGLGVEGRGADRVEEPRVPSAEGLPRRDGAGGPRGDWEVEPNVGRVADGVPSRVDRLRCLGNAIVPQVAHLIFKAIEAREQRLLAAG